MIGLVSTHDLAQISKEINAPPERPAKSYSADTQPKSSPAAQSPPNAQ